MRNARAAILKQDQSDCATAARRVGKRFVTTEGTGESSRVVVAMPIQRALEGYAPQAVEAKSLVEGAAQAMVVLDPQGRIVTTNPRALALLGHDLAGALSSDLPALVDPADRGELRARIASSLATARAPSDLSVQLSIGARVSSISITFLPFDGPHGRQLALLLRDAKDDEDLRDRIRRLQEQIERTEKLTELGGLLSGVAHELKTPVTYIQSLSVIDERRLARLSDKNPEIADEIAKLLKSNANIQQGGERIRRLLVELQPLTRNHARILQPVPVREIAGEALRMFGSTPERGRVAVDVGTPRSVLADASELARVLLNLLHNACEATGTRGSVRLRASDAAGRVVIRVEDDGPGVAPEIEARIFEPFVTSKAEGTGLGLAISRRIVEGHGGSLRYERLAPRGSAFVVELPANV